MKSANEIESHLAHFTGTDGYHGYMFGLILTDGAKEFAMQCECFWLLDILASVHNSAKLKGEDFLTLKIQKVTEGEIEAVVTVEDGNGKVLYKQEIESTGFPLDEYELFAIREGANKRIVLLKSEY